MMTGNSVNFKRSSEESASAPSETMDGERDADGRAGAEANGAEAGELEKLRESLAASEKKAAESHDRTLRVAADFENARKRWDREREEVRLYCNQDFARDLLPVIDAFEKAMNAIEESKINLDTEEGKKVAAIVDGIKLVSKVFEDSVKKHGIDRVPGKGQPFNPKFHNAVARAVDPALSQDMVLDEFVPGYKIGDRVLRTAMVRVGTPHE